jgi:hypothetical protein
MKTLGWKVSALEQRHASELVGCLSCYDRLIVYGTLRGLCHPGAVAGELHRLGLGCFQIGTFAEPLTESVRDNARRVAALHGLKVQYVADWRIDKEELVAQKLQARGEAPGLVCVLSAMENCRTFKPRKGAGSNPAWLKSTSGRCLHYYFYFNDEDLGLIYVRVPTWIPFRLQFYFNGHNWLGRRLAKEGIACRCEDNAIVEVEDWAKAQAMATQLPLAWLEAKLRTLARQCCPPFAHFGPCYLSLSQVEWSLDLAFKSAEALAPLCEDLSRQAVLVTRAADVARFFDRALSPRAEATVHFATVVEGVCRIRHRLGAQSLKMYNKGCVLRLEATSYDVTFFKHQREVRHHDGSSQRKVAPLKKSLYSLGVLCVLLGAVCRRYLAFLSQLQDPSIGRHNLDEITRSKRDARQRSWRGFNFFCAADLGLLLALARGEGALGGWINKRLRAVVDPKLKPAQMSRILRRLREHHLIRRIRGTFQYYLTKLGRAAIIAALKIKEHLIIPSLQPTAKPPSPC